MPHTPHIGRTCAWLGLAALMILCAPRALRAGDESPPAKDSAQELYEEALEYARGIERALVKSVAKVRLNSVTVWNLGRRTKNGPIERIGGGSGVIIQRKGKLWILTNSHVTARHLALEVVTHDGVTRPVVEHDEIPQYDISLLRFTEKPKRVKFRGVFVKARNSATKGSAGLKEGTWVLATGNPFFLASDGTAVATLGVVSGLDRVLPADKYDYVGAIQHDAEVNPGNSGGPLWNLDGDLLGINGKIFMGHRVAGVSPTNTGASFSLPVAQIESFLQKLIDESDAKAGYLGIKTETATDKGGKAVGARILEVDRRSPVAARPTKDMPRPGDLITSLTYKGKTSRIFTSSDLREAVSTLSAGSAITLKFKRDKNKRRSWKGKLGDRRR